MSPTQDEAKKEIGLARSIGHDAAIHAPGLAIYIAAGQMVPPADRGRAGQPAAKAKVNLARRLASPRRWRDTVAFGRYA